MTVGELDGAIRRALNVFDEWNDVAGLIPKNCGTYYEMQSVIEDAVHCGAQAALGIKEPLPDERKELQCAADTPNLDLARTEAVPDEEMFGWIRSDFAAERIREAKREAWAQGHTVDKNNVSIHDNPYESEKTL